MKWSWPTGGLLRNGKKKKPLIVQKFFYVFVSLGFKKLSQSPLRYIRSDYTSSALFGYKEK